MERTQDLLRICKVLEGQGHHIIEVYNAAGFLRIFVDGKEKTLGQMIKLWRG